MGNAGNKDLERTLNPWMYDKSGQLTDQSRKQFPDLDGTPDAITTTSGGGPTSTVHPDALRSAGANADALGSRVLAELGAPGPDVTAAAGDLSGWRTGGALGTAWEVWQQQYQVLANTLTEIGRNLTVHADDSTQTDHQIAARMRAL